MEKIKIERTKRSLPALWEEGGATTSKGWSRVIADRNGFAKKALYVPRGGHLCNDRHALFVVGELDFIIEVRQARKEIEEILIFTVSEINEKNAEIKRLHHFSAGEWDSDPAANLNAAIEAGIDKAMDYHCRSAYYIQEE